MKKTKKTLLIAAALTAAAGLAGCTNDPADSEIAGVYGPPPDYEQAVSETDISDDEQSSEDIPESTAEDISVYEPSEEDIPLVYGPPEAFE